MLTVNEMVCDGTVEQLTQYFACTGASGADHNHVGAQAICEQFQFARWITRESMCFPVNRSARQHAVDFLK